MLYVVRHAPAMDRIDWAIQGKSEDLRPLTTKGKRKFAKAAAGLARHINPKLIVTSELTRALQTAQLLQSHFPHTAVKLSTLLGNDFDVKKLSKMIFHFITQKKDVILVGHEPSLSILIGQLLTGKPKALGQLSKGAVACLEIERRRAKLIWLLDMEQLSSWRD